MSSPYRKESKKSKPQKYEEHERKVAAAIQYKHDHPDASWEFLHREFGPAANTIKNRFHNRTLPRRRAQTSQQRLSGSQEDVVVARIKELDAAGRPPTAKKIRAIANTIVRERYGTTVPPIGRQWVNRLYKRRSGEIARRVRRQLERERLAAQYRDEVEQHFHRLGNAIRRDKILPEDTWNSDQKGFQIGSGTGYRQVVYCDPTRIRANKLTGRKGVWITLHETISAGGRLLPAFYIITAKSITITNVPDEANEEGRIATSDKGYTNDQLCLGWLKHFNQHATPSAPGRPRLLIVDDLESYKTEEFDSYCREHNIKLYILPGHTTHLLQPCDVGVFSTFALRMGQAVDEWWDEHPFTPRMPSSEFIDLCDKVRKISFTPRNIHSSFRRAGVFPLNKRRVLDDSSIQWQARNPYRRKLDHLRPLSHRNPPPTEVGSLAAEWESICASRASAETTHGHPSPYTTALESWGQKALASLQKHEGELILTRHELAEVRRSKALKAADKRVLTRLRTGMSIKELRKARQDRLQKDACKKPRAKRSTAGSEGASYTQAPQPSTPPHTSEATTSRQPLGTTSENASIRPEPPKRRGLRNRLHTRSLDPHDDAENIPPGPARSGSTE